jgi:hypothetical protein
VNPSSQGNCMRWHELALQRWCYLNFIVADGYPVPVLFSAPMDAFSQFKNLWKSADNPFKYLLDLVDSNGTPVYEPYPATPKYPLISVHRKGWAFRPSQNYSYKRWRRVSWPTVSDSPAKQDLGTVTTVKMPAAWNFRFQVDHFCLRPETQSNFITALMRTLWRSGGQPQTWLNVEYPGHFYQKNVRMYLDGDIDSVTPPEPADGQMTEYRTSFGIVVEGYVPDLNYEMFPAAWTMVLNGRLPGNRHELDQIFSPRIDLRGSDARGNLVLDARSNVPNPSGPPTYGD